MAGTAGALMGLPLLKRWRQERRQQLGGALTAGRVKPGSAYHGPPPDPAEWPEPTCYIAPGGSDRNDGTSPNRPWQTFDYALERLGPGDTLALMDGTYMPETTGLPRIENQSGTEEAPITLRAMNERRAQLKGYGQSCMSMTDCSYWNILGLYLSNVDRERNPEGNFKAVGVDHVALKRVLSYHANRYCNTCDPYHFSSSKHVLVEDSEGYLYHRKAIAFWSCRFVTLRRFYAHVRRSTDLADGFESINSDGGDGAVTFYYTGDSIVENLVSEGLTNAVTGGAGLTVDKTVAGNNRYLGCIALNPRTGGGPYSRVDGRNDTLYAHQGNLIKDWVMVRPEQSGVRLSAPKQSTWENMTVIGGTEEGAGASSRGGAGQSCEGIGGCSFTMRNSLYVNNQGYGVRVGDAVGDNWLVEYANSYGNQAGNFYPAEAAVANDEVNFQHCMSKKPTGMGLGEGECIVFVPDGSNMKGAGKNGADIGANVLYRYVDGKLTDEPLWDPETGEFPHGAIVKGVNDLPGKSPFDVHERLNVNTNGCRLPYAE